MKKGKNNKTVKSPKTSRHGKSSKRQKQARKPRRIKRSSPLSRALTQRHNNSSLNQATKDMEIEITQYHSFDSSSADGPVLTYGFNTTEAFLFAGGGSSGVGAKNTRGKIKRVRVQAWPKPYVSLTDDPLSTNNLYGILAQVPASTRTGDVTADATHFVHTSSTQVLPTVDPDWYDVLDYDAEKLFDTSEIQPFAGQDIQTLFYLSGVNLTTGAVINTAVFDLQITFTVYFPIPVQASANVRYSQVSSFNTSPTGTSGASFALVDIVGMRDHYLT
jgi:hypothetical protein